jgi:hypothetical protein
MAIDISGMAVRSPSLTATFVSQLVSEPQGPKGLTGPKTLFIIASNAVA